MLRISQIKLGLNQDESKLLSLAAKKLKIASADIENLQISKKAVDARRKNDVHFVYAVDITLKNSGINDLATKEDKILAKGDKSVSRPKEVKYTPVCINKQLKKRPVVVGFGPAGMLAALILAEAGTKPIVIERGSAVEVRQAAVEKFWQTGELSEKTNVQFGEGGAGTFSDGKLTTNTKDFRNKKVLEELVAAGADPAILYLAKPHIGTDVLQEVVKNIRKKIIALGGEIRFDSQVTGIKMNNNAISALEVNCDSETNEVQTDNVIFAIGHSARDTFQMLYEEKIPIVQKPFAVGVRIEHLQSQINQQQYGKFAEHPALGAADYKLVSHLENGRSIYSFCMCPGGEVVAAASSIGGIVTNGMSLNARDSKNANSALLVGVKTEDFGSDHPLAGIFFQKTIEKKAFELAGNTYNAPCQKVGDFINGEISTEFGDVKPSYLPKTTAVNIGEMFPDFITESLKIGIPQLAKHLNGFDNPDAILTGPETRSSSPIRILRDENCQSIKGLYPCGEGAGYAGGIISAAVDGIKCAEAILEQLK